MASRKDAHIPCLPLRLIHLSLCACSFTCMCVGCVLCVCVFTCGLYVYELVWRFMVILSSLSYLLKQGCLLAPGVYQYS